MTDTDEHTGTDAPTDLDAFDARLTPDARAVLQQLRAGAAAAGPPPDDPHDAVAALRAAYRQIIPLAGEPAQVAEVRDLVVAGGDGPIDARLYRATRTAGRPLVVFLHGGSFLLGDLDTHDRPCRAIASASGANVLSVAYRLAPEHPFPAAPADAYAATAWAAEHADALGGDAAALVVAGDSAGGCLAAVTCQAARDRGGPDVALQILVYPDTDLAESTASWLALGDTNAPIMTRRGKLDAIAAYARDVPIADPRLSPLRAASVAGLPPALVLTGEMDPQRDEGEAYARRLEDAGVPARLVRYDGTPHGFLQMAGAVRAGRDAVAEVASTLRALGR